MYIFMLVFEKVVRTFISIRERISLNEEVNTSSPFYKNETKQTELKFSLRRVLSEDDKAKERRGT